MNSVMVIAILAVMVVPSMADTDKHLRGSLTPEDLRMKHDRYSSGSRSESPFADFFFGFILFGFGFPILWYNERRHLINQYRLQHAKKDCQSLSCYEVDPNREYKLVHTNGRTDTQNLVVDGEFGVSEMKCVWMQRVVEMYQWIEHRERRDNHTYYTYTQDWRSSYIDSSDFNQHVHNNERSKWIIEKQEYLNPTVNLGAYLLSDSLKKQVECSTKVKLNNENARVGSLHYGNRGHQVIQQQGDYIMFQQMMNQVVVGDLRVSFLTAACGDVTIVSQQVGNSFQPWKIHDKFEQTVSHDQEVTGCCSCIKALESPMTDIDWLFEKIMDLESAFEEKLAQNQCITHLLRFVGWLCFGIGLCLIFSPISYIISWFPLLGNFLASVTSFIFAVISFLIATPLTIIVVSLAWLYYRPWIGLLLVAISGLIGFGIYYYLKMHQ